MNGSVMTLKEDNRFLSVWLLIHWVHVDEKRGKNGNCEYSQTRKSFEPLRRINETQVDVRNEDNCTANNDDRSFRRTSCRPIDVTTQRTNQSVSTESTTKRDQTQPNRQKVY